MTVLTLLTAAALSSCASAAKTPESARTHRYPGGPCDGRGELFHSSLYLLSLPVNATITRTVIHRAQRGVCYTTPGSLQKAAVNADGEH